MTTGLRFFYRHICTTGLENIPAKGPAIIIANHNASLMDAALLGILLKRKAWFFARGDVFVNKPVQKLLWWLHMLPVHSHQGGRNTLGANHLSFSSGQQILSKGGVIVFFPESTSHTERCLLPFRKGVFRLGFDTAAAADFSFDIPIIPVGITYDHPLQGRSTVQVHAAKPIQLLHYKNLYKENAATALLQVCRDAEQATRPLVLHINERGRLQTAEQYLTISRGNATVPGNSWIIKTDAKLQAEKVLCLAVNNMSANEFGSKKAIAEHYFAEMAAKELTDETVALHGYFPSWKKWMIWLGFPFYLLGLLLNGAPVLLARWIADNKVYRPDFYSWIFVSCYSILYFFWLLLLLVICISISWWYVLLLLALVVATGVFSYVFKGWLRQNNQHKKWQLLTAAEAAALQSLREAVQ